MFLEHQIIMISEDHVTLRMSNDAENTALHQKNQLHLKKYIYITIENGYFSIVSQNDCIFLQVNAALMNMRL